MTRSVSGGIHMCGIRDTGEVACWGRDDSGQSTPPAGTFNSVSVATHYTCGVRDTGEVACWGSKGHGVVIEDFGDNMTSN